MRRNVRKGIALLVTGIIIGVAAATVFNILHNDKSGLVDSKDEKKLSAIMESIDSTYYKTYDIDDLKDGLYKGVVEGLGDQYSAYLTEDEYDRFLQDNSGSFYGIGVTILFDEERFTVVNVQKGSPAEKAGIKPSDLLVEVDGKPYINLNDMVDHLRGDRGTTVTVTMSRDGKRYERTMTRAKIVEETVDSRVLDGNIGYIQITSFIETTSKDFAKALADMEAENVKGLIVDIRDNGGGLLDEALDIADMLVDDGGLITYVSGDGKKTKMTGTEGRTKLEYVLLVNENSASASEVLAGAVKDNKGGKLVGSKTFGKGVIQITHKLYDGSAIKLTATEYRSPDGHVIDKKGIEPDIEVKEDAAEKDKQIEKAKGLFN